MITLRAAGAAATIAPGLGGRLASLVVGERELLVTAASPADSSIRWGSYLMAPWPGRLEDGRLSWEGRTIQLRRTHGRHAIHGLVTGVEWDVLDANATGATLLIGLDRDGWPFGGEVRQSYRLDAGGLTVEATIIAEQRMPAALGWHPWFRRGAGPVRLMVQAEGMLARDRMIPTGDVLPLPAAADLREGPELRARRLDDAYTGVRSPAILRWQDLEVRVEFGPESQTLVVYTPAHAVCVEPMTAWPNALALPQAAAARAGARYLEPGETLAASMRIAWARAPT
jgi:aldose 1-epimerase